MRLALGTDDVHSSQEQRPGALNIGGSDIARDLALTYIPDSKNNFELKVKVVRNFRQT